MITISNQWFASAEIMMKLVFCGTLRLSMCLPKFFNPSPSPKTSVILIVYSILPWELPLTANVKPTCKAAVSDGIKLALGS